MPERPHPNCRCTVEVVVDDEITAPETNENEEPCDCWDRIDAMVDETDIWQEDLENDISELDIIEKNISNIVNNLAQMKKEIVKAKSDLINVTSCGENCVAYITGMAVNISNESKLEELIYSLTKYSKAARESYVIFLMHKHEMEEARDGMDKYYHAKANCTAAELSEMHANWAETWSKFKEIKDFLYKTFILHMNIKDVYKDCIADWKADKYGIEKAKEHGYCSDKVRDVYKDVFHKK